jgi:hypothetical protein
MAVEVDCALEEISKQWSDDRTCQGWVQGRANVSTKRNGSECENMVSITTTAAKNTDVVLLSARTTEKNDRMTSVPSSTMVL